MNSLATLDVEWEWSTSCLLVAIQTGMRVFFENRKLQIYKGLL